MKQLFSASQFVPTQWDTAEDKAKFANQFAKFVSNGFQEKHYPKWFYTRLSLTFHHIAHYNQWGFWDTWFATPARQVEFLNYTERQQIYGDPTYTYSDVERALQTWLHEWRHTVSADDLLGGYAKLTK